MVSFLLRVLRSLLQWGVFASSDPTSLGYGKQPKKAKRSRSGGGALVAGDIEESPKRRIDEQEWKWILAAQRGKAEACEYLVRKYGPAMWGYFAYTCRFGTVESDDLLQESWIQIWRSLKNFRGDSSFRTWSMVICRRVGANAIRKQKRVPYEEPLEDAGAIEAKGESVDAMLELKERSQQMRSLFSALHEKASEILDLFYLQELSPSEISALLGIPEGTVKSRLADARKQLRRAWKRKYGKE